MKLKLWSISYYYVLLQPQQQFNGNGMGNMGYGSYNMGGYGGYYPGYGGQQGYNMQGGGGGYGYGYQYGFVSKLAPVQQSLLINKLIK